MRQGTLLLTASAALVLAVPAAAAPRTTVAGGASIQAAVDATDAGGTVVITDSARYAPFTVGRGITVTGAKGQRPEIQADSGVLVSVTGDATLRRLTVRGPGLNGDDGRWTGNGAGVSIAAGDVTLDHVTVTDLGSAVSLLDGWTGRLKLKHSLLRRSAFGVFGSFRQRQLAITASAFRRNGVAIYNAARG